MTTCRLLSLIRSIREQKELKWKVKQNIAKYVKKMQECRHTIVLNVVDVLMSSIIIAQFSIIASVQKTYKAIFDQIFAFCSLPQVSVFNHQLYSDTLLKINLLMVISSINGQFSLRVLALLLPFQSPYGVLSLVVTFQTLKNWQKSNTFIAKKVVVKLIFNLQKKLEVLILSKLQIKTKMRRNDLFKYIMRYQQQQKGLFTFYKEQQLFELQIELLKNKKAQEQQHQIQASKKSTSLSHHSIYRNGSTQKFKVSSQPAYDDQDLDYAKSRNTKIQQIGNSIVIINRKQTQDKQYLKSLRQQSYQEKPKQSGYFIEKTNVEFQDLQKYKASSPLLLQKRKKTYLRKIDSQRPQDKERRSTKLPTLMKIDEMNIEEKNEQVSHRAKINGSSLRYNGGDLMKYIRSNIHSDCESYKLPQKSVSYIEFNKGCIKQNSPKKLQGLNQQQKKLLEVLYRYRKVDK